MRGIQEKEGKLTEDEKYRHKDDLQEMVDETVKEMETMILSKEKEVRG